MLFTPALAFSIQKKNSYSYEETFLKQLPNGTTIRCAAVSTSQNPNQYTYVRERNGKLSDIRPLLQRLRKEVRTASGRKDKALLAKLTEFRARLRLCRSGPDSDNAPPAPVDPVETTAPPQDPSDISGDSPTPLATSTPTPTPTPTQPPNAIYVDGALASNCLQNQYDPLTRQCSAGGAGFNAYAKIQSGLGQVAPGDLVLIRAGTYQQLSNDPATFITVSVSGSANSPIIIQNYPGETVIIRGRGFVDQDTNGDGLADGTSMAADRLVSIPANISFIHLHGIEFANSSRYALELKGDHNVVEDCTFYDNWEFSVYISGDYNVLRHIESFHTRHGAGMILRGSGAVQPEYNLIEENLLHDNGRQADGQIVLPAQGDTAGGGNSDGFVVFKDCNDIAPAGDNLCKGNVLRNNVVYHNADDGIDTSFAESLIIGNISFSNGPRGRRGFKMLREVSNMWFVRNITFNETGGPQQVGFEFRNFEGGRYLNNLSIGNTQKGFNFTGGLYVAQNNLALLNASYDAIFVDACSNCSIDHNWFQDGSGAAYPGQLSGNPQLINSSPSIDTAFPAGLSTTGKIQFIRDQVEAAFKLAPGSSAVDAGTTQDYFDPLVGSNVSLAFLGAAPDIGAVE